MKIATYNINGINGRLETLLTWLSEAKPDIVCLQELKAPQAKFPERRLKEVGYSAVWHGQSRWNGVAIRRASASRCSHDESCRRIPLPVRAAISRLR